MGPHYITNTYKWVKMAVWDAPYRVWLDVELEKISIDRYAIGTNDEKTVMKIVMRNLSRSKI
jgi:hypothetical protein